MHHVCALVIMIITEERVVKEEATADDGGDHEQQRVAERRRQQPELGQPGVSDVTSADSKNNCAAVDAQATPGGDDWKRPQQDYWPLEQGGASSSVAVATPAPVAPPTPTSTPASEMSPAKDRFGRIMRPGSSRSSSVVSEAAGFATSNS